MTQTATVRIFGQEMQVTLVRQLDNGRWLARAQMHGPRTSPGTMINVGPNEIVPGSISDPTTTTTGTAGLSDLTKGLADERKALDESGQSVTDLINTHRANLKEKGQFGGGQ